MQGYFDKHRLTSSCIQELVCVWFKTGWGVTGVSAYELYLKKVTDR